MWNLCYFEPIKSHQIHIGYSLNWQKLLSNVDLNIAWKLNGLFTKTNSLSNRLDFQSKLVPSQQLYPVYPT